MPRLPPRDEIRERTGRWLPVRVAVRYLAVSGYDRALALATEVFVAVVPMLIVVAAVLPEDGRGAAAGFVAARLHLSGSAVDDLHQLVQRPPAPTEPLTLLGIVVLVASVLGFARTLQRTYRAAWELPSQGVRGYVYGLLGAAAVVAEVVVVLLVGLLLAGLRDVPLLLAALRFGLSVVLWWPIQWLLLGCRVAWRDLLPGAVLLGVGQVLVMSLSGAYLARTIEDQAGRYGLIGVAFVFVSWLIVLGLLIVLGAVVSVEVARGGPPPRRCPAGDV